MNEQIHDNVIGMYINEHYFKTGKYGDSAATQSTVIRHYPPKPVTFNLGKGKDLKTLKSV